MRHWINNMDRRTDNQHRRINIMAWRVSNMQRKFFSVAVVLAVGLVCGWTGVARGECEPQWLPGEGVPGVSGEVFAVTTWDPDGAGPEPELLVVGGHFLVAGDVLAKNIAAWDGSQWQPLGMGMNDIVRALTVYNGALIAGGDFTIAGGVACNRIARWDGSQWQPLGLGMSDRISALAVYNGELIAGGGFTIAGGQVSAYWARWGIPDDCGACCLAGGICELKTETGCLTVGGT